jgi:hypothetical protein
LVYIAGILGVTIGAQAGVPVPLAARSTAEMLESISFMFKGGFISET